MTWEETHAYWDKIVSEAYMSREPISQWCAERSIRTNNFHRWSKKLGYTKDGKKTEKCLALIAEQTQPAPAPIVPAAPVFVEVPTRTLGGFKEAADSFPLARPLITIQAGNYQIGIQDGFSEQTLSKVLEVVRYA